MSGDGNGKPQDINRLLTPKGPDRITADLALLNAERRDRHQRNAYHFLTTGESIGPMPYGSTWNREYNPIPYSDARPDPYMYMGTGIGALYGMEGSECFLWQLAGWTLVRTGAEQRSRKK